MAIALMAIWLILAIIACWLLGYFVKGMGNGVAPAEGLLMVAGLIGGPAAALLFAGLAIGGVQPLLRLSGLGVAVLVINTGLLCQNLALPMSDEFYNYSLIDEHPQWTGGLLVTMGFAGVAAVSFGHLLVRRRSESPR